MAGYVLLFPPPQEPQHLQLEGTHYFSFLKVNILFFVIQGNAVVFLQSPKIKELPVYFRKDRTLDTSFKEIF